MNQDVVAVISDHHTVLDWLIERLGSAGPGPTRRVLFDEFAKALGAHLRAIDETVIPALRAQGWRNVSSSLLVGHVDIKHRLGELITLSVSTPEHDAALAALGLRLQAQRRRETEQLLPLLQVSLGDWQSRELGTEVREHMNRVIGERPSGFADSEPAHALLEEARLVIGTFPTVQ
jgi:hypothetical protein